jgi:hypothetical protein
MTQKLEIPVPAIEGLDRIEIAGRKDRDAWAMVVRVNSPTRSGATRMYYKVVVVVGPSKAVLEFGNYGDLDTAVYRMLSALGIKYKLRTDDYENQ